MDERLVFEDRLERDQVRRIAALLQLATTASVLLSSEISSIGMMSGLLLDHGGFSPESETVVCAKPFPNVMSKGRLPSVFAG
ncbi:MAG: hypothetical protein R3C68_06995 [Myxococcota bacterium]